MTQEERLDFLISYLINENADYKNIIVPENPEEKRRLLRSLMNVRMPAPVSEDFLKAQDAYLQLESAKKRRNKTEGFNAGRAGNRSLAGRYHNPGGGRHRQRGKQPDAGLLRSLPRVY